MERLEKWVLSLFESVDNTFLGFFTRVGPYVTAAIPALLAGYGLYKQFSGDTDHWFGIIIGLAVGIGFEAAGIKIIHTAIEYSDKTKRVYDVRFILLVLASLIFVGLVSFTIFTADKAYPWIVRIVGGISPILAAMAYFAIGVEKSLSRETELEEAKKTLDLSLYEETERQKRQIELKRQQLEFKAEEARLEAEIEAHKIALAQEVQDKAAQAEHERQLEREKMAQKHERAMAKQEIAASTAPTQERGKPFRRYDEFTAALAKTSDLEEVSREMGLSMKTIRAYKRKSDQFNADSSASSALTQSESKVIEHNLNGHV